MAYDDVTKLVPGLHDEGHNFIVHFGVGRNGFITLERRADSGGYFDKDIYGKHGPLESRGVYVTRWDVEKLVRQLHILGIRVPQLR